MREGGRMLAPAASKPRMKRPVRLNHGLMPGGFLLQARNDVQCRPGQVQRVEMQPRRATVDQPSAELCYHIGTEFADALHAVATAIYVVLEVLQVRTRVVGLGVGFRVTADLDVEAAVVLAADEFDQLG